MDRVRFFVSKRHSALLVVWLLSGHVMAEYDCDKLDPRVKLSNQTEVDAGASANLLFKKIAGVQGEVKVITSKEVQNIQDKVPISEEADAANRMLFLLCEMMSKDDMPIDQKIALMKYFNEQVKSSKGDEKAGSSAKGNEKGGASVKNEKRDDSSLNTKKGSLPKKAGDSRNSTQEIAATTKITRDKYVTVDLYSDAGASNGLVEARPSINSGASTKPDITVAGRNDSPEMAEFTQECKDELKFQYLKYKQNARFPYYFVFIRDSRGSDCEECVEELAKFVSLRTGIPLEARQSDGEGVPGCIGYREDIGGSLKGAQCLQALLGKHYHVDRRGCSADGFPYPVRLRN